MSFSLGYKLLKLYCFWECRFGRDQRSEVNNDNLLVFISVMGILGMILPYVKMFFLATQMNFVFYGFKLLRFPCFQEWQFGRDQRSQFNNDIFLISFSAMEVLGMSLTYVKCLFSRTSGFWVITLVLSNASLGEIKGTQFNN